MASNTKLEFRNSPQEVTIRELLDYKFDLQAWLSAGETVSAATAKLLDEGASGTEIPGAVSGLNISGGNTVNLSLNWSTSGIERNRSYLLLLRAQIGSQFKEGFARFTTYSL